MKEDITAITLEYKSFRMHLCSLEQDGQLTKEGYILYD